MAENTTSQVHNEEEQPIIDIRAGFNAFNEPIFLFEENGVYWVENHATDWISEEVEGEEAGNALFEKVVGNADWNLYR